MTTTNLIPANSQFDTRQIDIMRQTVAAGVPPAEFALFLEVCKHRGLNPLNREIYAIMRYDYQTNSNRMSIQVSIDGLRILAERSGKYLGQLSSEWCGKDGQWTDVWLSDEPPAAARVRVMRADFKQVVTAVAKYSSYVQLKKDKSPTAMWAKMPEVMLAKCAESLALRKAFPETTAGLYTHEEMGQADNPLPGVTVDSVQAPSLKVLCTKGQDASLWKDADGFYEFCSDMLERQITRENGHSVTTEERLRINQAIDDLIRSHFTDPEAVESEPVEQDEYVSVEQISRELAAQKAGASA